MCVADVEYTMARTRYKFDDLEAYMATAYSVRDRLIEEWNDTQCVRPVCKGARGAFAC
jgi:starch phosphorylase